MVVCYLCKSSKEDDIQYGEMLQNENMSVHTFCLYLSSNLSQNGKDDEGFLGFLEADIKKEARRVSLLHCCYCRKSYANVGCCKTKCRHTFHLICGLENGVENQFCGSFQSFCHQHINKTKRRRPPQNASCIICYDNVVSSGKTFRPVSVIEAPCCHNGWFHKLCLQGFAKTAGYFFKCPLCNDSKVFRQKLPMRGIFIPNRDAAWELEPNAFAELLERPNECAAPECECKHGRTHSSTNNPFVFCSTCGSTAMHKRCIPNHGRRFHCADCTIAMEQDSGRESLNTHANNADENYDDIDICNVSEQEDLEIIRGLLPTTDEKACEENENCATSDEEIIKLPQKRVGRVCSSDSNSSNNSGKNQLSLRGRQSSLSSEDDEMHVSCTQLRNRKQRVNRAIRDSTSSEKDLVKPIHSALGEKPQQEHSEIDTPVYNLTSSNLASANIKSGEKSAQQKNESLEQESQHITINDSVISDVKKLRTGESEEKISPSYSNSKATINIPQDKLAITCEESYKKLAFLEESSDYDIYSNVMNASHISISSDEAVPPRRSIKRVSRLPSSDEVEIVSMFPMRNRNNSAHTTTKQGRAGTILAIDDDDDDESDYDDMNENHQTVKNAAEIDSAVAELSSSDESDDDPLENFTKLLEKEKNRSCIAQRTRTKLDKPHSNNSPTHLQVKTKSVKFQEPRSDEKRNENLDISCIAKRTRRKSMGSETVLSVYAGQRRAVDGSGRRQTVCLETPMEKNKKNTKLKKARETSYHNRMQTRNESRHPSPSKYEMSQIYEKQHYTDDEALEDKQLKTNQNVLEISCIANRTRKRKSHGMKMILDEDETTTSSCDSMSSYKTAISDLEPSSEQHNRQHAMFTSTEDTENIYKDNLATSHNGRYGGKGPKMAYETECHNNKLQECNNTAYHPYNLHHPHLSNRRRV